MVSDMVVENSAEEFSTQRLVTDDGNLEEQQEGNHVINIEDATDEQKKQVCDDIREKIATMVRSNFLYNSNLLFNSILITRK